MKPRLFIGSSVEGLQIAYALQRNLHHQAEVTVWDQGIFQLSRSALESLIAALETFDFGVFVFSPDDILKIRGEEHGAVRDNVLFELGLFIGKLGQTRCFILTPEDAQNLHLPTDLLGVQPGHYEADRSDSNWQAATGPSCHDIRGEIMAQGHRKTTNEQVEGTIPAPQQEVSPKASTLEPEDSSETTTPLDPWLKAFIEGRFDEASTEVDKALATEDDTEQRLNLRLWRAFFTSGKNLELGEAEYRSIAKEVPGKADPWIELVTNFLSKGFPERALQIAEEGLELISGDTRLLVTKAQSLSALQRIAEAEAFLEKELHSSVSEELFIQLIRLRQEHGKTSEALETAQMALSAFPLSTGILELKAALLFSSREFAHSFYVYRQLCQLKPTDASYPALSGNALLELNLFGLALESYMDADNRAQGRQAWIIANIGNLLNNRGLYSLAIEHLEKSLLIHPHLEYAEERVLSARQNRAAEEQRLATLLKETLAQRAPDSQ